MSAVIASALRLGKDILKSVYSTLFLGLLKLRNFLIVVKNVANSRCPCGYVCSVPNRCVGIGRGRVAYFRVRLCAFARSTTMGNAKASTSVSEQTVRLSRFSFYRPITRQRGEPCGTDTCTMKIFLIYGEKDAGKTTACRKILDWLNAHGWNQLCYEKIENPADNWFGDFMAKGVFNGKTIAIYSPGDECAHVRAALSFATESPVCDILIAAVRKGIHYNGALSPFCNSPSYTIMWRTLTAGTTIMEKEELEDALMGEMIQIFLK